MEQIVLVIHIIAAISLITMILIQQGKGAEVGASFGSGASQTIFGSQGAGSMITRATAILAAIFFITSLGLGVLKSHRFQPNIDDLMKKVEKTEHSSKQQQPVQTNKNEEIPKIPE